MTKTFGVRNDEVRKNTSTEDITIDALLKRKEDEKQARIPAGYVSIQQIAEKYAMTVKHVQKITCSMAIKEKKSIGGYNYFPSEVIEKAFAKYEANPWVKLWISAKDMEELYMMIPEARRSFAYRHKIPTKQVNPNRSLGFLFAVRHREILMTDLGSKESL